MLWKSSHEGCSQYAERNRILGGDWPNVFLLASIVCTSTSGIWPAQPCAWPILPNSVFKTWGIHLNVKASCGHGALSPKRHFEKGAFWKITSSPGDSRTDWFFKTKLKIQTSWYRPCISMLTHTPHFLPGYLSLCCLLLPSPWSRANNAGTEPAPIAAWCSSGL